MGQRSLSKPPREVRTVGVIARLLGVPVHRVQYVLRTCPDISPAARAGRLRLFDAAGVSRIRHELNRIDARRESRGGR